MRVYFATKNPHKFREVSRMSPLWIELVPLPEDVPEVVEDGGGFLENALKKALEYSRFLGSPVMADDSGLEIEALDGFPGVHSARFLSSRDYTQRMEKILKLMEGESNRRARFVCYAVFHEPGRITLAVRGEVEGRISNEMRGSGGFGYDPIFVPEGFDRTFGELGEEIKSEVSHRSRAFKRLFSILSEISSSWL